MTEDLLYAPGLMERKNRDGSTAYYWVAARTSRKARDYIPRSVRLHYHTAEQRALRCRELTAEMWEVLGGRGAPAPRFDGTIGSLCDLYQTDPDSPYQDLKYSTRRSYDDYLKLVKRAVGARRVDVAVAKDARRWYKKFAEPKKPGAPRRISRAHHAMTMIRMVVKYGAGERLPGCAEFAAILSDIRFENTKGRDAAPTWQQVQDFIDKAHEKGYPSMALAVALQFETTLRQINVIGEWFPGAAPDEGGIVDRGHRWGSGLVWGEHIDEKLRLDIVTTKRGRQVVHDLSEMPMAMKELERVPQQHRIGPVIINEATDLPYRRRQFAKTFRIVARAAGWSDEVWNMDNRAGGITEGSDAGADLEHLRQAAGHSNTAITSRYNRPKIVKSQAVSKLRAAARKKK